MIIINPNPKTYNTILAMTMGNPFGDEVQEGYVAARFARNGINERVMVTTMFRKQQYMIYVRTRNRIDDVQNEVEE